MQLLQSALVFCLLPFVRAVVLSHLLVRRDLESIEQIQCNTSVDISGCEVPRRLETAQCCVVWAKVNRA
jgi:hypothetical protein